MIRRFRATYEQLSSTNYLRDEIAKAESAGQIVRASIDEVKVVAVWRGPTNCVFFAIPTSPTVPSNGAVVPLSQADEFLAAMIPQSEESESPPVALLPGKSLSEAIQKVNSGEFGDDALWFSTVWRGEGRNSGGYLLTSGGTSVAGIFEAPVRSGENPAGALMDAVIGSAFDGEPDNFFAETLAPSSRTTSGRHSWV